MYALKKAKAWLRELASEPGGGILIQFLIQNRHINHIRLIELGMLACLVDAAHALGGLGGRGSAPSHLAAASGSTRNPALAFVCRILQRSMHFQGTLKI